MVPMRVPERIQLSAPNGGEGSAFSSQYHPMKVTLNPLGVTSFYKLFVETHTSRIHVEFIAIECYTSDVYADFLCNT